MKKYTFTHEQLIDLLMNVVDLRDEYQHSHGFSADAARWQAASDTLEGLDAEQELLKQGEKLTPTQIIE